MNTAITPAVPVRSPSPGCRAAGSVRPSLCLALLLFVVAIALSSCAGAPLTLAYINDDVYGHSLSGAVTIGGKAPKATIALTKRNSGLLADSGK